MGFKSLSRGLQDGVYVVDFDSSMSQGFVHGCWMKVYKLWNCCREVINCYLGSVVGALSNWETETRKYYG